jgi:DNA-binding NarL/FixJ family response regulator
MKTTTILVAQAHRLAREGVKALLARRGFDVVEASDGAQAAELALAKQPDAAVLDAKLPGLSGVETVRRIAGDLPQCRCVVLLDRASADQMRACLRAGAMGLIDMASGGDELLAAIAAARLGRRYLSPGLGTCLADAFSGSENLDAPRPLSKRQREVLQLIVEGRSTQEIADQLGLSYKTAQSHRANLMNRLQVHKVSSLVRYAIREGLVRV